MTAARTVLGALACAVAIAALGPWSTRLGLAFHLDWPTATEWGLLSLVVLCGTLEALLRGWRAYRMSLADGLSPRG